MYNLVINNTEYEIREETYQEQSYLAVPVIMMRTGVHNGSAGPIYHDIQELGHYAAAWDGIPLTAHHPEVEGQAVSANSPEVLERFAIGQVFGTYVEGDALKAEAWVNIEQANRIDSSILEYIRNGLELQVSVGVFSDNINRPGQYNGESYQIVAQNHKPDHLALLPGAEGACSWTDGCGIRNNESNNNKKEKTNMERKSKPVVNTEDPKTPCQCIKEHLRNGRMVVEIPQVNFEAIQTNEKGYREIIRSLQGQLDAMDTPSNMYFLEDVFSTDTFIYRVSNSGTQGSKYFQRGYQENVDGTIEITGEPVEVRKEVSFNPINLQTNNNSKMAKIEKGKVDELIINKLTQFTETDREWLEELPEAQFNKLTPNKPEPQTNEKEDVTIDLKEELSNHSAEQILEVAPEGAKTILEAGLEAYKAGRKVKADHIIANTAEGVWSEESLNGMDDNTLESIFKSIPVVNKKEESGVPSLAPTDYSLQAPAGNTKKDEGAPALAPTKQ